MACDSIEKCGNLYARLILSGNKYKRNIDVFCKRYRYLRLKVLWSTVAIKSCVKEGIALWTKFFYLIVVRISHMFLT